MENFNAPCPLKKLDDWRWELPRQTGMNTEGLVFASEKMISAICGDKAHQQVANVAHLPGIVGKSLAMPDIHWGYGFPIGGVAAFDLTSGVISPGGIGYDICCGIRLLRTNLKKANIENKIQKLIDNMFYNIPSGVGSTGKIALKKEEVKQVLNEGAKWAVKKGYGTPEDLKHTEEEGCLSGANADKVSSRALERGHEQLGTLGAGNHFLEIQEVEQIFDETAANAFGLFLGQITVMIHTGSRGLGYQVCDDSIRNLQTATQKYAIRLPDRQLVCAPVESTEGKDYFSAMAAAANYAWANRQIITHWVRQTFTEVLGKKQTEIGLELVYDVAHNIGKFEQHLHNGKPQKLFVHRKGATRAFPAGQASIPEDYKTVGQPVIVPGTMGTASYILAGTQKAMYETWGSTCHGAGRVMSRTESLRNVRGRQLVEELGKKGIILKAESYKTLAEEAPQAYKDVNLVVEVCHQAGISKKVAKMRPLGVIKG
ncbi:MAG: RNA-splicing ligase RtcB [Elusimicrobia bacterium RIFOXYA2_FULL_39_19]|nr:MAG: RNA-splicing ligase RtcB [Elusimicrobia bacterium RIFOXYA2_FULL_39_19]